ncbi:hypothetical protein RB195_013930 [Necator americanus]|uniref:Uncharacterized protein n=1 Tax=Necator americanus TaxID=51031 RepID=A0ABR1DXS6_NECAM
MDEGTSTSNSYERVTSNPFRISLVYASHPLKLSRPLGNIFNLQTPDGGRASKPLLHESYERSGPGIVSSQTASNSWSNSNHNNDFSVGTNHCRESISSSRRCNGQQICVQRDLSNDFMDVNKYDVHEEELRMRSRDNGREITSRTDFCPSSQHLTSSNVPFVDAFRLDRARTSDALSVPKQDLGIPIRNAADLSPQRPKMNGASLHKRQHFTEVVGSSAVALPVSQNAVIESNYPSTSFSPPEQVPPKEQCISLEDVEMRTMTKHCGYIANSTPPDEGSLPQVKDIDYSLFDEFFVRI